MAALQSHYEISVLTSANDHNSTSLLAGVKTESWMSLRMPNQDKMVNVWYAQKQKVSKRTYRKCIADKKPSVVYLNGMFSFRFVIIPLLTLKKTKIKVVLCPRGMLQSGALAGKSFKKSIYLNVLKISGLVKKITWHATNEEEAADIKKVFGKNAEIVVAPNIPKSPFSHAVVSKKEVGQLRLVYISLIAEKKNLLQLIDLINASNSNISLDIYGPAKDEDYFRKCMQEIETGSRNIKYMGDLRPEKVQDTFSKYDASVLLTKGENFGHALYESLSVGRPVITSYFTPWNGLEQKKAGWNLDIADNTSCLKMLESIADNDNHSFNDFCTGAYTLANQYYADASDLTDYYKLFSV